MPAQVIWSLESLEDLTGIFDFIAADNPAAGENVAKELKARTRQLAVFPLSGRHYDFAPMGEIRELIVPPHRIFYRVTADAASVRILRVWHSARGLPELPRN